MGISRLKIAQHLGRAPRVILVAWCCHAW
jgi:hypothetical protein